MSRHARGVVAGVVGLAVAFALLQAFASGTLLSVVTHGEPLLVKTLGFLGCAAAAASFQPGEHLRRAWIVTALALRGGRVSEAWTLLALANLSWLLFDAQSFLPDEPPRWMVVAVEETRLLACTLAGAAGLLQRRVARGEPA